MKVTLAPAARQELIDGAQYYARESGPELGRAFISEVERTTDLLSAYPTLGAFWRGKVRRLPLRRFPYSVIYRVVAEEILVIAITHQNRKPGYWRKRV